MQVPTLYHVQIVKVDETYAVSETLWSIIVGKAPGLFAIVAWFKRY